MASLWHSLIASITTLTLTLGPLLSKLSVTWTLRHHGSLFVNQDGSYNQTNCGEQTGRRSSGQRGDSRPEQDSMRFHQAPQNSARFKIYKLFISAIIQVLFPNFSWLRVPETVKHEQWIRWGTIFRYNSNYICIRFIWGKLQNSHERSEKKN